MYIRMHHNVPLVAMEVKVSLTLLAVFGAFCSLSAQFVQFLGKEKNKGRLVVVPSLPAPVPWTLAWVFMCLSPPLQLCLATEVSPIWWLFLSLSSLWYIPRFLILLFLAETHVTPLANAATVTVYLLLTSASS